MSSTDPTQFTNEDLFQPIYCVQCKKHTPRATLDTGGSCPECSKPQPQAAAPVPAYESATPAAGPVPGYPVGQPIGGRATDLLPPDLQAKLQQPMGWELTGFHWGAFLMGWIWAIGHRLWAWAVACLAASFFCPLADLILCYLMAKDGYRLAWESRDWKDANSFRKSERIWTYVGVAFLLLNILWWYHSWGGMMGEIRQTGGTTTITVPGPVTRPLLPSGTPPATPTH